MIFFFIFKFILYFKVNIWDQGLVANLTEFWMGERNFFWFGKENHPYNDGKINILYDIIMILNRI